jgi:hypothetical protein
LQEGEVEVSVIAPGTAILGSYEIHGPFKDMTHRCYTAFMDGRRHRDNDRL